MVKYTLVYLVVRGDPEMLSSSVTCDSASRLLGYRSSQQFLNEGVDRT